MIRTLRASVGSFTLIVGLSIISPIPAFAVGVDVGNGLSVAVNPSDPLRIAFFAAATGNSYLQANIKAAKETAAKIGATVDVFDGKFDATTQFNQVQNALQSKKYNAFIIQPVDGQLLCKVATEEAPKAGILVSVVSIQMCGRATNPGKGQWAPGTLNFVGGAFSIDTFRAWIDHIAELNPGPQKVGVITGPDLNGNTANINKVLEELKAKRPDFQIVAQQRTDYSVPVAMQKAQNMIQANSGLTIIISDYSNLTRGVVSALAQAGKVGKIKVYDAGGTTWAKAAIEKGDVELTIPQYAYTILKASVESLAEAHNGKPGPHYIENDGAPKSALFIIDKSNVGSFEPESD